MAVASLPHAPTTFVGRERELAEICALLRQPGLRLLTVTGPGGCGKSRVAIAVARRIAAEYGDGVVVVPLDGVGAPSDVLAEVAQALDIRVSPPEPVARTLAAALEGRDMLLVLDGFEHVIDAAPDVAAVIAGDDGPCLLVTSREPLHVEGESEYALDPMESDEATTLFGERARAVLPSFDATAEREVVAALCARLDGLPLAIELAAARVKLFSPQMLLGRLDQGLDVLSSPIRGVPARQRTLEGAIEWSYRLLGDDERPVFERISVFRDGARLDALEEVCGATTDVVASLVDKSLLRPAERSDGARFSMLATLRDFAAERLAERPDADDVRRRHAEHVARLVSECRFDHWRACEDDAWRRRVDDELLNVRAALDWATPNEPGLAATIAVWMQQYWSNRGMGREGRARLAALLAREDALSEAVRTDVRLAAASFAGYANDLELAEQMLSQLEPLVEAEVPSFNQATALLIASWCAAFCRYGPQAVELAERAGRIATALGDRSLRAAALNHLSIAAFHDDPVRARSAAMEAAELHTAEGNHGAARGVRVNLALLDVTQGRAGEAQSVFEAVRAEARPADDRLMVLVAEINLGMCHVLAGRADEAAAALLAWIDGSAELGNRRLTAELLFDAAGVAALRGDPDLAATLVGAADAIIERTQQPLSGWEGRVREHVMATPLDEGRVIAGRSLAAQDALAAVRELLESTHRVERTFLFTDVVRSTRLVAEMGDDAWARLLA
jgi:predicted ATPase